jgi:pyruvate carboxylase
MSKINKFLKYLKDVNTSFIEMHPELFAFQPSQNRAQKLLNYLGHLMVNGPLTELGTNLKPANIVPTVPQIISTESSDSKSYVNPTGWRDIYVNEGAKSFAKAIRDHTKNTHQVLLMDTTMRGNF